MQWYLVIKTINGHQYYYKQKTYRVGRSVRTQNIYVGPVRNGRPHMPGGWTSGHPNLDGAVTLPLPFGAVVVTPVESPITGALVQEVVSVLADEKRAASGWMVPWASRKGKSKVARDPRLNTLIAALGVQMTRDKSGAWYRPATDEVNMPGEEYFVDRPGQSASAAWHSTFFHELTHWTKAKGRSYRERHFDQRGYAREELVAELGAVLLMRAFKIDNGDIGMSARYFQTWLKRSGDEAEAVAHATKEAEKAVKFILEHGKVQL